MEAVVSGLRRGKETKTRISNQSVPLPALSSLINVTAGRKLNT